jgi:putative ABC transport system substrate-binding protein
MRRRDFIGLVGSAAVTWPRTARAQRPAVPVIGYLNSGSPAPLRDQLAAFRHGLSSLDYVEGKNLVVEYRWAEDQFDLLPSLAADLVQRHVAVIVAGGGQVAALAAKAATATIPIVFLAGGDPVKGGLVTSLNRPKENITGVSLFTAALHTKRLELLHELAPGVKLVGYFVNPNSRDFGTDTNDVQAAARTFGLNVVVLNTSTSSDFEVAFAGLVRQGVGAIFFGSDPIFQNRRDQIIALASRHKIPAIYVTRAFSESGGLMSYGDNIAAAFNDVGVYVGKILRGAKPADLPVLQPTKFEFVINRKTAKALGLQIPDKFLALADEVIE